MYGVVEGVGVWVMRLLSSTCRSMFVNIYFAFFHIFRGCSLKKIVIYGFIFCHGTTMKQLLYPVPIKWVHKVEVMHKMEQETVVVAL